jgi:hypothetical protein
MCPLPSLDSVHCPVCQSVVALSAINAHIDQCLSSYPNLSSPPHHPASPIRTRSKQRVDPCDPLHTPHHRHDIHVASTASNASPSSSSSSSTHVISVSSPPISPLKQAVYPGTSSPSSSSSLSLTRRTSQRFSKRRSAVNLMAEMDDTPQEDPLLCRTDSGSSLITPSMTSTSASQSGTTPLPSLSSLSSVSSPIVCDLSTPPSSPLKAIPRVSTPVLHAAPLDAMHDDHVAISVVKDPLSAAMHDDHVAVSVVKDPLSASMTVSMETGRPAVHALDNSRDGRSDSRTDSSSDSSADSSSDDDDFQHVSDKKQPRTAPSRLPLPLSSPVPPPSSSSLPHTTSSSSSSSHKTM